MAREGHRRSMRLATAESGPFDGVPEKMQVFLKSLLFMVLIVVSAALLYALWPFMRWGVIAVAAGLVGVLLLLWHYPKWLFKHLNLPLGFMVLMLVMAAGLSLYHAGWGGRIGDAVATRHIALAVFAIGWGIAVALWIAFPRYMLAASRAMLAASIWAWGKAQTAYRGAKVAALFLAAVYAKYPLHTYAVLGAKKAGLAARNLWLRMLRKPLPQAPISIAEPKPAPKKRAKKEESPAPAVAVPAVLKEAPKPRGTNSLGGWKLPPMTLLAEEPEAKVSEEENQEKAHLIEQTLTDYGIEVTVEEIHPGPVVTQFGLVPGWARKIRDVKEREKDGRVKLDKDGKPIMAAIVEKQRVRVDTVLNREKDLALALAARSLRFEAPVPGKGFIGLEVPNTTPQPVTLRGVLDSPQFKALQKKGNLPIAIGKGSGGEAVVADLADMPHLLIAGSTGSGKSVCMNTIVGSLLMQSTPFTVRCVMTDPKRVELTPYNGIPHLAAPVVVESSQAVPMLRGVIGEMQERFKRLEAASVRNIASYNQKVTRLEEKMPYLVVIIDELADLMMTASTDVEASLCRLAQLGRAVGIHLVVATQRPSVDVITGLIKANFPSRISFAVTSGIDSRTILDGYGAEKLLGRGDMLFSPLGSPKPKRVQGAFVSDGEIQHIVSFWKEQQGVPVPPITLVTEEDGEEDEMLERAKDMAEEYHSLSASLLQRKLGIGYPRASRLMDRLEELGVVTPGAQGKSRATTTVVGESKPPGE
ncbi:MAG: DNA translocase FtsK [Dehalococcoidia bacterium]|nr:DNA translocase FtsK [Dehalococcoidia bacterium]